MNIELSKEHRAAIDQLSLVPGVCKINGCGKELICVCVEKWRGTGYPHPPARFACATHEVWLGFCFDEGDPEDEDYKLGIYEAILRNVADTAWHWLPQSMREAAVKAGFGVRDLDRRFRVGVCRGRAWATDGSMMIDIGPESEAEAALDRSGIVVTPAHKRAEVLEMYRIPSDSSVSQVFAMFENCTSVQLTEPVRGTYAASLNGKTFPNERAVLAGKTIVASYYIEFAEAVYPNLRWFADGPNDPVFACDDQNIRAVVMPILAPNKKRKSRV